MEAQELGSYVPAILATGGTALVTYTLQVNIERIIGLFDRFNPIEPQNRWVIIQDVPVRKGDSVDL